MGIVKRNEPPFFFILRTVFKNHKKCLICIFTFLQLAQMLKFDVRHLFFYETFYRNFQIVCNGR